jgi:hypothetical protein
MKEKERERERERENSWNLQSLGVIEVELISLAFQHSSYGDALFHFDMSFALFTNLIKPKDIIIRDFLFLESSQIEGNASS